MSAGLVNQIVALCAERYVIKDQFRFTGKYGCFRNWQDQNSGSRYMGVSVYVSGCVGSRTDITMASATGCPSKLLRSAH